MGKFLRPYDDDALTDMQRRLFMNGSMPSVVIGRTPPLIAELSGGDSDADADEDDPNDGMSDYDEDFDSDGDSDFDEDDEPPPGYHDNEE